MNRIVISRKWAALALAPLLFSAGAILRADDALPKAETILDRYIEVTGGAAAYKKHKTEIRTGTMEFAAQGLKGSITIYSAEPDKSYAVTEIEGIGKFEQGTVDGVAWEKNALTGARVKSGTEKAQAMREGTFNGVLNWRKMYTKAETVGVETINGEPCYKVVMTPNEGKPETGYYSRKTGLELKAEVVVDSPQGELTAEVFSSEYKTFDGVLTPSKIVQQAAGQEFVITVQSVKMNEEIPPGRFDLPADVKALVGKPATKPVDK
jgi:hypothetical protein